jgi:hypothetical protein
LEHISTYMLDTTKDEGVGGTMVYGWMKGIRTHLNQW